MGVTYFLDKDSWYDIINNIGAQADLFDYYIICEFATQVTVSKM